MSATEMLSNGLDSPMVNFALDYAQRGWPVFPCHPTDKTPYINGGHKSATTDPETIRQWWTKWPRAMIGVPMGSRSGVWAIDCDPPKKEGDADGRAAWSGLVQKNGALPATHTEDTPRGGQHILFAWDPKRPVTNSPGALKGQSIDIRGEGGYVIMAPSVSTDGRRYSLIEPLDFFHFAVAPEWLYEMLLPSAVTPSSNKVSSVFLPDGFWHRVNSLALQNPGSWVPAIFPSARFEQGTGAWRISSRDLGRDLVEDLSISPRGIKDWGVWDIGDPKAGRRSAIDIVIEHGGKRDPIEAALWLCERCGVDPASLGWRWQEKIAAGDEVPRHGRSNDIVTEDSAAVQFVEQHGEDLRYCHSTGSWFRWNGIFWVRDQTGLAFHWARELARKTAEDQDARKRYITQKRTFANGVEGFAKVDPQLAVTTDHWDRDPWLLGTPGGAADLRTGRLRPSARDDAITKTTSIAPAAIGCPLWLQFLNEATGNDEGLIRFLRQWCGYCLTGVTNEHALLFVYGDGGNGKSVFLNVVTSILKDYAATSAMETFTASNSDKHPTDLAMLRGARLVTASETEAGKAWAESRIKQITGGDPITARFMRQDFFTFVPHFKLTIIGNHKPTLHNVDEAARRRFNIVPFTRKPATPDPRLGEKLMAEAPAILHWMIEGCLDWQKHGLVRPACVIEATEEYFSDQEVFPRWLEEECITHRGPGATISETSSVLYRSWSDYARSLGAKPGTQADFKDSMRRAGFTYRKRNTKREFVGIRLRPKPSVLRGEDDADDDCE